MKAIKLFLGMAAVAGALTMTSCGGDDDTPTTPAVENTLALCQDGLDNDNDGNTDCDDSECQAFVVCEADPTVTLEGEITENMDLDASKVYILKGLVRIADGVTVNAPAGTIFKAEFGQAENASAFIVTRGAKFNAAGTAANPVIFTSIADQIQPGQTESTLTPAAVGQWGGVIILGKAPVSTGDGDTEGQIEGIDPNLAFGKYGGSDASDSSGSLEYVSIRFTGTKIGDGDEIQALSLGGVGNGTKLENIELISSSDDGVEFFGGTVNVTNLLVAYQADDAIDLDQNYAGTVKNAVVFNYTTIGKNSGFEFDGPENTTNTGGKYMIENATVYAKNSGAWAGNFKKGSQGTIKNCKFVGFGEGHEFQFASKELTIDGGKFSQPMGTVEDGFELTLVNDPVFGATEFSGVGADESVFEWTWSIKTLGLND